MSVEYVTLVNTGFFIFQVAALALHYRKYRQFQRLNESFRQDLEETETYTVVLERFLILQISITFSMWPMFPQHKGLS